MSELELYTSALLDSDDVLVHHGIKGQKHGVRNGPPYPLSAAQRSAAEGTSGVNPARKNAGPEKSRARGEHKEPSKSTEPEPKKNFIQRHKEKKEAERLAAEKAAKKKAAAEKRAATLQAKKEAAAKAEAEKQAKEAAEKERIDKLYRYNPMELLDHRLDYSAEEIQDAIARLKNDYELKTMLQSDAQKTYDIAMNTRKTQEEANALKNAERKAETDAHDFERKKLVTARTEEDEDRKWKRDVEAEADAFNRKQQQQKHEDNIAKFKRGADFLGVIRDYGKVAIDLYDISATISGKPTLTDMAKVQAEAYKKKLLDKANPAEDAAIKDAVGKLQGAKNQKEYDSILTDMSKKMSPEAFKRAVDYDKTRREAGNVAVDTNPTFFQKVTNTAPKDAKYYLKEWVKTGSEETIKDAMLNLDEAGQKKFIDQANLILGAQGKATLTGMSKAADAKLMPAKKDDKEEKDKNSSSDNQTNGEKKAAEIKAKEAKAAADKAAKEQAAHEKAEAKIKANLENAPKAPSFDEAMAVLREAAGKVKGPTVDGKPASGSDTLKAVFKSSQFESALAEALGDSSIPKSQQDDYADLIMDYLEDKY